MYSRKTPALRGRGQSVTSGRSGRSRNNRTLSTSHENIGRTSAEIRSGQMTSKVGDTPHVEQITHGPTKQSTMAAIAKPDTLGIAGSFDQLQLPNDDAEDSSESSLISPHSEEGNGNQTGDDESIAVNCHANPSEVIVKGKNVKQIRVKFPPHPPNLDESQRTKSGRTRLRRSQSGSSVRDGAPSDTNKSRDETLPYPQEETSLPAIFETPAGSTRMTFPPIFRQESAISLHSQDLPYMSNQFHSVNSSTADGNYPNTTGTIDIDWANKYKQDILLGLEYFDRRACDFKEVNNRLMKELEIVKAHNNELEKLVERLQAEQSKLVEESDEIKIKLDQSEKENCILQEQAISQWQSRVKAEEMYVELQRDSLQELNILKDKINEKDKEITLLKSAKSEDHKSENKLKNITKSGLTDDNFELLHTVSRLQDEVRKLTREKEAISETSNKLRQDVADMKSALKEKSHELESQYKRFLSLKKSFNDLMDEHEKLKIQFRGRSLSQNHLSREQHQSSGLGNSTWPTSGNNQNSKANSDTENVSYIDLPKQSGKPGATNQTATFKTAGTYQQPTMKIPRGTVALPKTTKASSSHKRTKSEGVNLPENLPPVSSQAR